jgi:hypothetical protein
MRAHNAKGPYFGSPGPKRDSNWQLAPFSQNRPFFFFHGPRSSHALSCAKAREENRIRSAFFRGLAYPPRIKSSRVSPGPWVSLFGSLEAKAPYASTAKYARASSGVR